MIKKPTILFVVVLVTVLMSSCAAPVAVGMPVPTSSEPTSISTMTQMPTLTNTPTLLPTSILIPTPAQVYTELEKQANEIVLCGEDVTKEDLYSGTLTCDCLGGVIIGGDVL